MSAEHITQQLERVAAELNRRIASCHERLACPTCRAPRGERCHRMPIGYHGMGPSGKKLAHPHRARWSQETPPR